jgi:hypothetical protein
MLPKCCAEHQKPDAFQGFCPTFQKLFLKRDLFDSFNGLRYAPSGYWWVGRDHAALTESASSHAKCLKTRRWGEGAFECDRTCPKSEADGIAHPGALCRGSGWLRPGVVCPGCSMPGLPECTPRSVPEGALPEWGCVGQRS